MNDSVSIIGVGATPFGDLMTTPELKNMTERELCAWAALEAMEQAGIEAKDIDAFYLGNVMDETLSRTLAGTAAVTDWLGLRFKAGFHHEIGCATGSAGLLHAVQAVASGAYKIVLAVNVETTLSRPIKNKPPHLRERLPEGELFAKANYSADAAYWRPSGTTLSMLFDAPTISYARKYGVTLEQIDEVLNIAAINNSLNGAKNPLAAMCSKDLPTEAQEMGFDDVYAYMKSTFNPKLGSVARMKHMTLPVDGATAVIVCSTSLAKKLVKQPMEVAGLGAATGIFTLTSVIPWRVEQEAFNRAYAMADIKDPYREVDYMSIHDCTICSQFISSETGGYFQPGEAWQAILDGRTRPDGDKPINTSGGRTAVGHAWAASNGMELYETVSQMKGTCGDRQLKKTPRLSVVHTLGGGIHSCIVVLRSLE